MALVAQQLTTDTYTPLMLREDITDQRAWIQPPLMDWYIPFPESAMAELDHALHVIDQLRQPVYTLTLDQFPHLNACRRVMAQVHTTLHQTGMAILDRLPVERYHTEQNKAIYWLLGHLLGRVVDQKWGGTRLYDVKDAGKPLGHGVRRSVTNLGQPFHTDGPWLSMTPQIVGLFCLQTAQAGGMSRLVSLVTAHNEMRRLHPDLIERLYRPFFWDRQAEHGPDDAPYSPHPVFAYDGEQLSVRYYDDYIHKGYVLAGEELDAQGEDALEALQHIVNDPAHSIEFRIDRGQLQFINNRQFAHARTKFSDDPGASMPRHLIRCWYRNEGLPGLEGQPV